MKFGEHSSLFWSLKALNSPEFANVSLVQPVNKPIIEEHEFGLLARLVELCIKQQD